MHSMFISATLLHGNDCTVALARASSRLRTGQSPGLKSSHARAPTIEAVSSRKENLKISSVIADDALFHAHAPGRWMVLLKESSARSPYVLRYTLGKRKDRSDHEKV